MQIDPKPHFISVGIIEQLMKDRLDQMLPVVKQNYLKLMAQPK